MRAVALLLSLFLLFSVFFCTVLGVNAETPTKGSLSVPTEAAPDTSAASMALYDPGSGSFLALQDADRRRPMASTTKIMTALVILEHCDLDASVTVPPAAVGVEGSSIYLYAGERIAVRTLLYALLLSSANDAATALAIHAAGSVAAFADLMNQKAASLGLVDTHFTNPHGLHDDAHYTTARELALLTAAAMENETFAEMVATKRYSAPQDGTNASRLFLNHNRLLRQYEGAVGVKTGFTKKSGRCLVSAARRDDLTLIAVTLSDGNDWRDHEALYDWGFSEYEGFSPTPDPISLPVVGGTAQEVTLLPDGDLYRTLPKTHGEIICHIEMPRFLFAGFEAGKTVGALIYTMEGKEIGRIPLKVANGVEKAPTHKGFFERIKDIFT